MEIKTFELKCQRMLKSFAQRAKKVQINPTCILNWNEQGAFILLVLHKTHLSQGTIPL